MAFCLPKFASKELLKNLKDGTVKPDELIEMTSAERRDFFAGIVGKENAVQTNALFESKLLLKNQQQGIINWAKQITGIKPEIKRDILSRVNKMTEVLQPKELDLFLEDIASKRLGFGVSVEEASKIVELSQKVTNSKQSADRLDYGKAKVEFNNYIQKLKEESKQQSLKQTAKDVFVHPFDSAVKLGGQTKSLKASLDNSAILRQGWKTLFTHPTTWMKNAAQSFSDLARTFSGKEVLDEVKADIISRPTYDVMQKAKLAIGTVEEAFPGSIIERIPVLGRLYKASETAYTGFVYKMRADVFDQYLKIAEQSGVDITDKEQLQSIGHLVNSLTGRGSLGKYEGSAADAINNVLFSPRFLKSHFDVLTAHMGQGETSFVKKQAAKNLLKIVGGIALILGIARAIDKNSVELDPRSSDFGKIKVGDSRFDVSGGMSSILTLGARLLTFSSKSTMTGDVNPLNSGKVGSQTGFDVGVDFFANKTSPLASVLKDYLKGQDTNGNKPTFLNEANNLITPLPITTFAELKNDPNSAPIVAAMILDGLGVNVNSYASSPSGIVGQDKPEVLKEVMDKLANGDREGAQTLAHDFNTKLKDAITADITKKDTTGDPEKVATKINTKWKKDAIYIPTDKEVADYKANPDGNVVQKILSNGKPVIVKDTAIPTQGIIGTVLTYARAIGADPSTAFNDIFSGQKISQVTNGTVIVERMSLADSQNAKKKLGATKDMILDHWIPLELGGSNSASNLKLVPKDEAAKADKVENYLGDALKSKKVDKATAQKLIIDFKNGETTFDEIKKQVGA